MTNVEEKILKAFEAAGKPMRPGDVARIIGIDSKDVSKVINELKKKGKLHSPTRCYYASVK